MIKGGSLTEVDREDLRWGVEQGVDFIGLSFVTDAADLRFAREVASWYSSRPPALIAKIERPDALDNVRGIAAGADGLMVARGDLGVQMPPERVPRAQKDIIKVANGFAIPVITATQMLESMITQPVATRAETSDVANAVWDGTDAVMLSAETAIGQYPVEAVRTMGRIIREAERDGPIRTSASLQPLPDQSDATLVIADAIARAARELADEAPVEHIVVFTLTGASVRRVAKYRPKPAHHRCGGGHRDRAAAQPDLGHARHGGPRRGKPGSPLPGGREEDHRGGAGDGRRVRPHRRLTAHDPRLRPHKHAARASPGNVTRGSRFAQGVPVAALSGEGGKRTTET